MKSKGGKVQYQCPNCRSEKIKLSEFMGQKSGLCDNCDTWWPWSKRLRVSLRKEKK